jgi:hypothetical protein
VTSILTNSDAERLILDVRVARAAVSADVSDSGGFVVFPTSVLVPVPGRGDNAFPLHTSTEPGSVCRTNGWSSVCGVVDGVTVEGRFSWTVVGPEAGGDTPPEASYAFCRSGRPVARPAWADQLPRSLVVTSAVGSSLSRQRTRMVRRGAASEHELLSRTARIFERTCRGPLRRAIAMRPALDVADVVQRGLHAAVRLLPVYASAARPPCSWLGMIRLDGRRDLHRAVTQLDWLPRDVAEIVARLQPGDTAAGRDPTVTLGAIIEAAVDHGHPVPRATASQVRTALTAPHLVPLDGSGTMIAPSGSLGRHDPRLTAAEEQHGELTASVARLVRAQPSQVVQASLGDDLAIAAIGDQVVAALRRPGETRATTRQRSHRELRAEGKLFTSSEGLRAFAGDGCLHHLAQLDAALAALVVGLPA